MLASRYSHTNIVATTAAGTGADINLQDKVSSSANIVCVRVCLTAVHLAYSSTILKY